MRCSFSGCNRKSHIEFRMVDQDGDFRFDSVIGLCLEHEEVVFKQPYSKRMGLLMAGIASGTYSLARKPG